MGLKNYRFRPYLRVVGTPATAVSKQGNQRASSSVSHAPIRVLWLGPEAQDLAEPGWELVHVGTIHGAELELQRAPIDIAVMFFDKAPVADSTAPRPAALLQFLGHLRDEYPRVIRIALSHTSNERTQMATTLNAHQTLTLPCDPTSLKRAVASAAALQRRFHYARLQKAVGGAHQLPSPPSIYLALNAALRSTQQGLHPVVEVIQGDPGLTARILQVVNSPALGVGRAVGNVTQAVGLLGVERIRCLVLALEMTRSFETQNNEAESLQQHGFAVADLAARIAGADRSSIAYTAGLLHDVGKLVMLTRMPKEYNTVTRSGTDSAYNLEMSVWGFSHAEMGAYLLGLWGLPLLLVETVANHHAPQRNASKRIDLATVIHVADALVHEASGGPSRLDPELTGQPGAEQKLEAWRSLIS